MNMMGMMNGGMGGGCGGGNFGGRGGGGGKKNEKEKKVKVTNVPADGTWEELKAHMESAGTVEFCTTKNGMAEVRFKSEAEAKGAIEKLNGSIFKGNALDMMEW